MSKHRTVVISSILAAACALGLWRLSGTDTDAEVASTSHFANRLWIERMPTDERDMVAYLAALKLPEGRFGATGRASQWRQFTEVFRWALEGDRLRAVFPQEGIRAEFQVRTWDCRGEAPRPFELCLRISKGERAHVFYSMEEWEIRPRDSKSLEQLADYPGLAPITDRLPVRALDGEPDDTDLAEADAEWFPID
jgi:hypothetical protein